MTADVDPAAEPIVALTDVTRRFGPPGGPGPEVLRGVTLAVARGSSLAITGPSGSGKSTLLNIIGALDQPTSGRVMLDGRDLAGLRDDDLAAVRNRSIGFVFQSHHLLPQLSALENVLVPTLVDRRRDRDEAASLARELLDAVGLAGRMDHRPARLSGGECQRVAVVRALVNRPALLLADEPTGSLDAESSEALADLLVDLNRERGVTLIVVTHAAPLAARMRTARELRAGVLTAHEGGS